MTIEPGRLLASGRDGDIFEFAPGPRAAARRETAASIEHEARIMRVRRASTDTRCREIDDVRADGTEIVMERIDGPMMMDAMLRKPWKMGHYARVLADLHDRLHVIPAPDWLPDARRWRPLVHLDLHPMNVMHAPSGPVVIDWTNARAAIR